MTTHTIALPDHGQVDVTAQEYGAGRPFLLLHGGAGPQSVTAFAERLAARGDAQVLVPIHPGFGGTARPVWLDSIARLAEVYAGLLGLLGLSGVTLVGNSIGGWLAAETALRGARISRLVLVDAVGIAVEGHPVADIFPLSMDELARLSYHNPAAFRRDPAAMTEAERRALAANREALAVYGGQPSMSDPSLAGRLAQIRVPTLVLWGESDRIVDPDYGRAYAAAIPGAEFRLLLGSGHVPQIETPELLLDAVWSFAAAHPTEQA